MFLHEFGEDFVLALQLLFQQGDPPVLVVAGAAGAVLECGSGVLEELLLPTVEHRGVNAVLVAQIRHRGVFEEMEPKYGDLLRGAEAIPSFLGHGKTSARDCSLFERLVLPIPTEAKHSLIRMALGNPLSCLQQAFARLLARFHKKFLTFRSSFVGAWFDAAGAVAYSVVCNRPEHRCYQALPVRWQRPSQRLLECRHRLKSPLEADQSRLFVMRLGRLGCHASYQVIR